MSGNHHTDSFTSATESTKKQKGSLFLVAVSGTFVGTIKLKWDDDAGVAHTVQEEGADLSFTAAGERVLDFGVPVNLYAECTAYTNGTAVVYIKSSPYAYANGR
jgi:phosphatidylserine decarboxylase